jgi:hypothetical protein
MGISWADLPKRPSPARDMIIPETSAELSAACTASKSAAGSYQTTFDFDDISRHPSLTPRLSPRPVDPLDRLTDKRIALTLLEGNRQLPGEDLQLVSLCDHSPLKRRGEPSDGLRARQKKSRASSACPHPERHAGQRFADIIRAALELVSDCEISDSADETSSDGTLSARSASSADFARIMGMLELSSDDDDGYHDRTSSPHALSPIQPDRSQVSDWYDSPWTTSRTAGTCCVVTN